MLAVPPWPSSPLALASRITDTLLRKRPFPKVLLDARAPGEPRCRSQKKTLLRMGTISCGWRSETALSLSLSWGRCRRSQLHDGSVKDRVLVCKRRGVCRWKAVVRLAGVEATNMMERMAENAKQWRRCPWTHPRISTCCRMSPYRSLLGACVLPCPPPGLTCHYLEASTARLSDSDKEPGPAG